MKKLILMTMISISLFSCKKEEIKNCNCGKIENVSKNSFFPMGIESALMDMYYDRDYLTVEKKDINSNSKLYVKNNCTNNVKKFKTIINGWLTYSESESMEGQEYCSNQSW